MNKRANLKVIPKKVVAQADLILVNFSEDIKYIRSAWNLFQAELAEALEMSTPNISFWENNKHISRCNPLAFFTIIELAKSIRKHEGTSMETDKNQLIWAKIRARKIIGSFTKNVIYIRKKMKVKQSDFGSLFGVTDCIVCNWENGRAIPRVNYRILIMLLWAKRLRKLRAVL